ncbi:hypothetical protein [Pseudomonas sp. NPDC089401]|uniref:hypothetical protein n=1 Tax=Pseudomonas sp. NPDC089401 TaxID=3364462 RepID=UPI0037FFF3DB
MKADDFLKYLIKYENAIKSPDATSSSADDPLNPLVIADMDTEGRESSGFGWNELSDPTRPAPMMSRLPKVVREGDVVKLFWTLTDPVDQPPKADPLEPPVQQYELDSGTVERGWLSFAVKKGDLNLPADPDIPYPYYGYLYYSLYDQQADDTRYSEYRKVLIDLRVPGGLDPDQDTPINEFLTAPIVEPAVIEDPATVVTITLPKWRFQQEDDLPTLFWGGVRHTLTRLTAGDVDKDYVFQLPREVLEEAGSGERLEVQFEVRDLVQNYSRPSPIAYVRVEIDPNALEHPKVKGAENPPYELDLDPLAGGDVTVEVPFYTGFAIGDEITLHFVGLTADGVEVPYHWDARTVATPGDLIFQMPYAYAAFVVKGTARVFYESKPASGGTARPSKVRRISVIGTVAELLPPDAIEAVGDTIDLVNVTGDLFHVRVPAYPGQMVGDVVTLTLTGQPTDGLPLVVSVELTVSGNGELIFEIAAEYLQVLIDGSLTLSYTVFTPELNITRRSTQDPTYQIIDSGALELPAPTCVQVQGSGSDAFLPSDTPTAVVEVPASAPLRIGDVVTLRWATASGTIPEPHTETKTFDQFPFTFTVTNADISRFEDLDMSVTYSVERNAA